jgi:hypothetical protein
VLNYHPVVGVAQLVERRSVAPNVAGSIPVSHPKNSQYNTGGLAIPRIDTPELYSKSRES